MVTHIARASVDEPLEVRVETEVAGNDIVLHVFAAPNDIGKLIGSQGRMARSLRTLLAAISVRYGHTFSLKIEEPHLHVPESDPAVVVV